MRAEELDRDPELKLGPAANSMERREKAAAEREGREYVPVTERGAVVHAARQAREAFRDMRERLDLARETYGIAREEGQGRVSAGLAALRAAAAKDRGGERETGDFRERLARITGRDESERDGPEAGDGERELTGSRAQERLRETLGQGSGGGSKTGRGRRRQAVDPRAAGRGAEQAARTAGAGGRARDGAGGRETNARSTGGGS